MNTLKQTSTLIVNPLTPIKTNPVKGPVALLTFGNVTIQLEQQMITSLVLMLPVKEQFNRTVELIAASLKEISREMQFSFTSTIPKEHRDSDDKKLLGMDNLLNPESFVSGDHVLLSKNKMPMEHPLAELTLTNNHTTPEIELEKIITEIESKFTHEKPNQVRICAKTDKPCKGPLARPPYHTEQVACTCLFMEQKEVLFKQGKALIISGRQGTGKTKLAKNIAALYGCFEQTFTFNGQERFQTDVVIVEEFIFARDAEKARDAIGNNPDTRFIFTTNTELPTMKKSDSRRFVLLDL